MDLGLAGRTAMVTGASRGIGWGIADELAREGCNLAICARDSAGLEDARAKLTDHGVDVVAVPTDMVDETGISRFVDAAVEQFGGVDILVNNAGSVGNVAHFEELTTDDWRELYELNVFSVVAISRRVVPHMRAKGWGRIINISSENGTQPYPDMAIYNTTKGALDNLTKTLSKLYGQDGILVNTVSPAFIRTPLVEQMLSRTAGERGMSVEAVEEEFLSTARPGIVLGRAGTIEETAGVVAWLASERASFVTGSNYRVDGGSVMAE